MGYQFIRVEVFARAVPKKSSSERQWTVRDIVAECEREPGNHPHIERPRPPVLLHGVRPAEVEKEVMAAAEQARDPKGRRLRRDAPILLAGVTSYPVAREGMTDEDQAAYAVWEVDTIQWLRSIYGDRLRSVVRHEDERSLHLHHLCSVDLVAGERIEAIHPGRQAMADARSNGCRSKKELNQLYQAAMREFQSRYHAEVGIRHGMTRHGPRRRRLSRAAWRHEQAQAQVTARVVAERDLLREENAKLRTMLDRVHQKARDLIAVLVVPTKALLPSRPEWLSETLWNAIGQRARAFAAVGASGRAGIEALEDRCRQAAIRE